MRREDRGGRCTRASWKLPLAGFLASFLFFAGLSSSNQDIRTQAETIGLVVLALFPAIGFLLARREGSPRPPSS